VSAGLNYTSALAATSMCSNSIAVNGLFITYCAQYLNANCPVATTSGNYYICVGPNLSGYYFNTTTGMCTPNTAVSYILVGNGQQCGVTSPAGVTPYCGMNLQCVQSVCRPMLQLGANCGGTLQCGTGLVCNGDLCLPAYSQLAQGPCKASTFCREGQCANGVCTEIRSMPCYSNADCVANEECNTATGFCSRGNYLALANLAACQRAQCSSISTAVYACTPPFTNVCLPQYISSACQTQCLLRPDARNMNDGYVYDCTALTRTIQNTTCTYGQSVINCPSTPISGAFVQGLSVFVFIFILSLFA